MKTITETVKPSLSVDVHPGNRLWEKTGLVLISGFLYAIAIASVDQASLYIPPATFTALRVAIASIIFCVILCFVRPQYQWSLRGTADIFVAGLLNVGLPFFLLAIAVQYISSSLAAVLFNTMPVFTIVLAHFLLADEKLDAVKLVGTITAVAGATILVISNASGLTVDQNQGWIGQFIIITASVSGALGVIYTRIRLRQENPVVLAAGQVFACLAIFAPMALVSEGLPAFASYPWQGWTATFAAAVSAPVIAYWLLFYMINKYSASLAGFSGVATPLFSVLIGILLLGEVITVPIAFGTLLLLVGVWSLNYF
jgi:drug/metabolite transporter (DMT)-like permease